MNKRRNWMWVAGWEGKVNAVGYLVNFTFLYLPLQTLEKKKKLTFA